MVRVTIVPGEVLPVMVGLSWVAVLSLDGEIMARFAEGVAGDELWAEEVEIGVGESVSGGARSCFAGGDGVDCSCASLMVTVAGVVPTSTLVAPSPNPPTNVLGESFIAVGLSVLALALNFITATVLVPLMGCFASWAPTVMDVSPASMMPEARILGNSGPLVIV